MPRLVLPGSVRVRVTAAATLAALVVAVVGSLLFVHSLRNDLVQGLESSARDQVMRLSRMPGVGSASSVAA